MARQFVNLAEIMGQVDNARANESNIKRQNQLMQMQDYEYEQAVKKNQEEADLKGVFAGSIENTDGTPKLNEQKLIADLYSRGYGEHAAKMQKMFIDRDQAIATANGKSVVPFFKDVYDSKRGAGRFNARTGEYSWDEGNPIVRPQDDPSLKERLSRGDARGKAGYKINTDTGQPMTEQQVAEQLDPSLVQTLPNINYMPTSQPPLEVTPNSLQVPPEVQKQRDNKRLQILLEEQKSIGGAGKDQYLDAEIAAMNKKPTRFPTVAEQAAEKERATKQAAADVELRTKPDIEAATTTAKKDAEARADDKSQVNNRKDALSSVKRAIEILDGGIYAGFYGGAGKAINKATPFTGKSKVSRTEEFISEIGNTVVPRLKEFGGNDSNEEMKYLKAIMGGDISLEPEALKKILANSEAKIKRGIERHNQGLDVNGKRISQPKSPTKPVAKVPKIGTVEDGHVYLGGDPSKPSSWKKL